MVLERSRMLAFKRDFVGLDKFLLLLVGMQLCIGLVANWSTSFAGVGGNAAFGALWHAAYIVVGLVGAVVVWLLVPLRSLRNRSMEIIVVVFLLMIAVHVPFLSAGITKGAQRWVEIGGVTLQPVELVKPALMLYVCACCASLGNRVENYRSLLPLLLIFLLIVLALYSQPDFGSIVMLSLMIITLLFVAGANLKHFAVLLGAVLLVILLVLVVDLISGTDYRLGRLLGFQFAFGDLDKVSYQQQSSLMAFGRGGLFGVGLGMSLEKWSYLPEAGTDFIIAVIAEETGLLGFLVVITFYAVLCARAFAIASGARARGDVFAALLAFGIGFLLSVQVFVNIGVAVALLPVKGLTLPLLSRGGSSMVAWLLTMMLLLMIAQDNRLAQSAARPPEAAT